MSSQMYNNGTNQLNGGYFTANPWYYSGNNTVFPHNNEQYHIAVKPGYDGPTHHYGGLKPFHHNITSEHHEWAAQCGKKTGNHAACYEAVIGHITQ